MDSDVSSAQLCGLRSGDVYLASCVGSNVDNNITKSFRDHDSSITEIHEHWAELSEYNVVVAIKRN